MNKLKRYFITGLVVVVPFFLTIYVLLLLFKFVDSLFGKFLNLYIGKYLGIYIPGLGFLIFLILIILSGFLATIFIGRRVFPHLEKWFSNLPLINKIYPIVKQIVLFILQQKEFGFKKVVIVEYPSKGIWSLGFLTNEQFSRIRDITNQEMASVFIPSSPGPLTGYVVFIPKENLRFVDISVSDALKIIISGGVFKP